MRKKNLQQNKRARIKLRLKGRAWVKLRRTILTVIAVAALAIPAAAMAMEVDIPYEQDFTNDSAKPSVADSFNYRLTADDSAPMPEGSSGGSYDFSLAGDTKGVLKLDISFAKPGYYYYTVKSHEKSSKKGYTYESKVYKVMVMIVNLIGLLIKRRSVKREEFFAFLAYILAPTISMIIQLLFYGITVIVLGSSIAALFLMAVIRRYQTEQYMLQQKK